MAETGLPSNDGKLIHVDPRHLKSRLRNLKVKVPKGTNDETRVKSLRETSIRSIQGKEKLQNLAINKRRNEFKRESVRSSCEFTCFFSMSLT